MNIRRTALRIAIALVVIAAVVYGIRLRGRAAADVAHAAGPADASARVIPVQTAPAARRDVPLWIEGLGTVAAWQTVTVRTQVDGRLDKVLFREGQRVKKGQSLAQIDPRPFAVQLHTAQAAVARDQAQLDGARKNLERYQELRKTNLVSQQQVDDQAALTAQLAGSVQGDQAAVESARLNLDYAQVRAPIDGVLGVRLVDAGNMVHAADAGGLVVLTQLDPVAVIFTVPQDELGRIERAQAAGKVTVEALGRDGSGKLGSGELVVIDNQINQATSTLKLKAAMPNPAGLLWPNQFVKARLLAETRRAALVVPAAAVQRGPQGTFVYAVGKDDKAELRTVEVAVISGDTAVVSGKIDVGDAVVTEGQGQLRPGAKVAARPPGDKPR